MTAEPLAITATVRSLRHRFGYSNLYECIGPDGARFDNTEKTSLVRVLRRRYGRPITLTIIDERVDEHRDPDGFARRAERAISDEGETR